MADNKNVKNNVWVYAVILFTSAFIVLLFAAYSQIKLNRNLVDYKNQISSQKSEKSKYQLSFANVQQINDKLNEENRKLEEEKISMSETIDKLELKLYNINEKSGKLVNEYEKLSSAQTEYFNGNAVTSAFLLREIDKSLFDLKTRDFYELFSSKAEFTAGEYLYEEGYKFYKQSKYNEAKEKLSLCLDICSEGEFLDNCLYYLAKSEFKTGMKESAIIHMNSLIEKYPSSSFISSAKSFIK